MPVKESVGPAIPAKGGSPGRTRKRAWLASSAIRRRRGVKMVDLRIPSRRRSLRARPREGAASRGWRYRGKRVWEERGGWKEGGGKGVVEGRQREVEAEPSKYIRCRRAPAQSRLAAAKAKARRSTKSPSNIPAFDRSCSGAAALSRVPLLPSRSTSQPGLLEVLTVDIDGRVEKLDPFAQQRRRLASACGVVERVRGDGKRCTV